MIDSAIFLDTRLQNPLPQRARRVKSPLHANAKQVVGAKERSIGKQSE